MKQIGSANKQTIFAQLQMETESRSLPGSERVCLILNCKVYRYYKVILTASLRIEPSINRLKDYVKSETYRVVHFLRIGSTSWYIHLGWLQDLAVELDFRGRRPGQECNCL
jgi:hypothetical protein